MTSVHGLVGDDYPTELPQTNIPDEQGLVIEKNMAKFSKSREFKKLKEHFEQRIEFYQNNMPDGRELQAANPTAEDWRVANAIIRELKAVISVYETVQEAVDNKVK